MNAKIVKIGNSRGLRSGWGKAFQKMAKNGDDNLLDEDIIVYPWDEKE